MNTETLAVVRAEPAEVQGQSAVSLFGVSDPDEVIVRASRVASTLKEVIRRQGLISNIQGKEYPKCEAWTLLGTMLGVFPVLCWTRPVEGGWEARVEARTRDGAIVGAAEAECLRSERNWANRDDFALRSMCQTRATAKALRMPLGFVMSLSGFEATPAEEMVSDHPQKPPQSVRKTQAAPSARPAQKDAPKATTCATAAHLARMLELLQARPGEGNRELVTEYFRKVGALLPSEENLEDLQLRYVPLDKEEMGKLTLAITEFEQGEEARVPFPAHDEPLAPKVSKPKPAATEPDTEDNDDVPYDEDEWRSFPMPFGKQAGTKLADLNKKYLYGLWANYVVEKEYNGKPKREETIQKDRQFRAYLDDAGKHYEFTKKD